ncbi:PREDICTED: uncharacterized protein LOC106745691 isoform X2 [Dinoponera quadriceps]|uniref:Uncharacterized protein LOC106745691 isoform X2 n=1 Tax=Dinoponera quadriceps TaxID=609295 RepID=A0A6P3XG09_DINQU|nr:PREDICTED: uncharacterized protein LOC106745691 isoform X2 [Dinoponera quadriceps]
MCDLKKSQFRLTHLRTSANVQSENQMWTTSSVRKCTVDESYRQALQQFIDRRRMSSELVTDAEFYSYQPIKQNGEHLLQRNNNRNCHNNSKQRKYSSFIPGVSHVEASEIFEIGCVAGTEDRYLELVSAEWHNTRVSLKRHTHPACQGAIKADIEILTEIRHPNVLLLMATTHTDEHGLVSIFESINCTLYNFIHEQGERMGVQNIAQVGMKLADALKYCHMRGYIHGAISSHCVYLVPNGGIKLGGWELATLENDNTQRSYEKCLRAEIFKWQAPEFFFGYDLSTKSDVYGLSLLLWEMGTACVPWSGCNRPHVELQYTTRKRGITVDLNNFPPRLQKLLENGLQLDAAKRTLDMDKIRKSLHRLLMSEEAEATYASESGIQKLEKNNNIKNMYTSTPKISPSYENVMLIKRLSADKLNHMTEKLTNRLYTSTMVQCNRDLDENNIEKKNASLTDNGIERLATEVQSTDHSICRKHSNSVKAPETGEKLHNTTRSDIKRLKEINASRREHFFNENNPSFASSTPNPTRVNKNTDYVLCKPASHATNMELKYKKSPGEYEGNIIKPSHTLKQKIYTNMPASIKDAIAQRQVLHSDVESFYESILWRKEKLICLSRMGRENNNNNNNINNSSTRIRQCSWPLLPKSYISVTCNTGEMQHPRSGSTKSSDTFTIANTFEERVDKRTKDAKEPLSKDTESNDTSMGARNFPGNSLKNLKDAIERAAEIVRSGSQYEDSVPYLQTSCNSETNVNNTQKYESAFEDLYETKCDDNNQEISVIEKSSGVSLPDDYATAENSTEMEHEGKVARDFVNYKMYDATRTNNLICETIAEVDFNESQTSVHSQQQLEDLQKPKRDEGACINSASNSRKANIADFNIVPTKAADANTYLLPSNIVRCETCNLYDLSDLRRRSLPACLNHLKITQSPGLKKIHAHKSCLRDSNCTIEDLYIDDEFGSRLNDNLVLLNDGLQSCVIDDYSYDDQNLLQTTEL